MEPSSRQDLFFRTPWLNVAGMLGFIPPRTWCWPHEAGAFVTNPVSLAPRRPAAARRWIEYPGGALLHTGLPNPGLRAVLDRFAARWARLPAPVWMHLIPSTPEEAARMVRMVEDSDAEVFALELGLPPGLAPSEMLAFVQASAGDLPLVVSLPLTSAGETWLALLASAGASAISLSAPRGSLAVGDGAAVTGRLYGPALFPLALAGVTSAMHAGLPVIASGGIYCLADAQALLAAGASAVQLDTVLWGWPG